MSEEAGFFRLCSTDGFDYIGQDLYVLFGRESSLNSSVISIGMLHLLPYLRCFQESLHLSVENILLFSITFVHRIGNFKFSERMV